jgi:DEAD/DEAH box helicase domain-containing protein
MGLSDRLYELHADLLQAARDLVTACPCLEGCPACVGPVGLGGGEVKAMTVRLIEALQGAGPLHFQPPAPSLQP